MWGITGFVEAAQNAATLAGITRIAENNPLFAGSGDDLTPKQDLRIIGALCRGDSSDITRWDLGGPSIWGGRKIDFRKALIDTGAGLVHKPVPLDLPWPADEVLNARFAEDKATNVEAAVLIFYQPAKEPWQNLFAPHPLTRPVFSLTVTGASSTAVVFQSTKNLSDDNHDSRKLVADQQYLVHGYAGGIGGSSAKIARLLFHESPLFRPGVSLEEAKSDPVHGVTVFPRPIPFTGKHAPIVETYDVDGSLTPITSWFVSGPLV